MSQSYVQLGTDGTGKKMDTQTTASTGQHRQVVAIGDPSTDASLAAVTASGLAVNVLASVPNLTLTSLPVVTVQGSVTTTPSGTQNVSVVSTVPNLTLTSLPSVTVLQGTSPWVTSGGSSGGVTPVLAATVNGLTINGTVSLTQGAIEIGKVDQGIQGSPGGAWPVITVNGSTATVNQGTPASPTLANSWPVNVVSSVPNLTLTSLPTVTIQGTVTSVPSGTQNVSVVASVPNLTLTSLPNVTVNQGTNPWVVSVTATVPNLTLTSIPNVSGTVTVNQGVALAPTVVNAWPVNVVSSVPNLTLTSLPVVTIQGSVGVTASVPNLTLTSIPAVTQGTNPWVVSVTATVPNLTLTSLPTVTVNQGTSPWVVSSAAAGVTPVQAATVNGLTINGTVTVTPSGIQNVNVVSSVPNLTLTSLPTVTIQGTVNQGTPSAATISNAWPVNVVSSVPGLTILSMPAIQTTPGITITALGNNADNDNNPSNKVPVLPARANASAPSWTEGHVVPLSVDTSGALRVSGSAGGGVAQTQVRSSANAWVDVGYQPSPTNLNMPVQVQNGLTITSTTPPSTSTVTSVDFTTVNDVTRDIVLLNANASRRSVTIFNNTDTDILINEGAVASMVAYSDFLPSRARFMMDAPACTAAIHGYFPVIPTGRVLVTERV